MVLTERLVVKDDFGQAHIAGNWTANPTPRWEGSVTSDIPLASLTLLRAAETVYWLKSERSGSLVHPIVVNLFRYDSKGYDIQLNYAFNNAVNHHRTQIDSPGYLPALSTGAHVIGELFRLLEVQGRPALELFVLLLPMSLLKVVRSGIWHIRLDYLAVVESEFHQVLQGGRRGKLTEHQYG